MATILPLPEDIHKAGAIAGVEQGEDMLLLSADGVVELYDLVNSRSLFGFLCLFHHSLESAEKFEERNGFQFRINQGFGSDAL